MYTITTARMSVTEFLTAIEQQLRQVLTRLDTVHRAGHCGPQTMALYGEMRHAVLGYVAHQRDNAAVIEAFVQASLAQFAQCTTTYTSLYAQVYEAMDRAKRSKLSDMMGDGNTKPAIKQSSVPLDPQSALNVVECGTRDGRDMQQDDSGAPTVYIKLHNDNETLLKFPPSSLYRVPHIGQTVRQVDATFDKHCEVIHGDYMTQLHQIRAQVVSEASLTTLVSDAIASCRAAVTISHEASGALDELYDMARRINALMVSLNALLGEQRLNCETYAANVHAKFMVPVQLYDNMLRPYNLTRLHQQTEHVSSLF